MSSSHSPPSVSESVHVGQIGDSSSDSRLKPGGAWPSHPHSASAWPIRQGGLPSLIWCGPRREAHLSVSTDAHLGSLLARRCLLNKLSRLPLRYYFKKASDEFACGAVFEEIWDDETVLPMYEGRILGKVERID